MRRRNLLVRAASVAAAFGTVGSMPSARAGSFEVTMTDAEWRKLLTPAQFAVLRQSGTERPFTSQLLDEHRRRHLRVRRL